MTLEEYKKSKNGHTKHKGFKKLIIKGIICTFLIITILSICKLSDSTKELVKKELFQTDFNFSKINKIYSSFFNKEKSDEKEVSINNELNYKSATVYKDGVSLSTTYGESLSLIDSGIVVYIGEKEGYGNTVIVQQSNGVDVWYGNVENINIKIYDYINKNTSFATLKDELYLVFQKNGEYLNYKEYIQ